MSQEYQNKVLDGALTDSDIFINSLFNRPKSISQFLPYDEYIHDRKVFVLKDGSLGAIYKVTLLEHEPLTANKIIEQVDSLKSWFNLPETCVLQIHYEQARISSLDNRWEQMREFYKDPHPVSKELFEARLKGFRFVNDKESNGDGNVKYQPLERSTYISIRYFTSKQKASWVKSSLSTSNALLLSQTKEFLKELRYFSGMLDQFKGNSKIVLKQLNADQAVDLLRRFFNPKTYYKRKFAPFNPSVGISQQIIYNNPILDYEGIEREGFKTRVLSLKTAPLLAYPGGMAYFTKLDFPFKLSLNFSFPSKSESKRFFDIKEFLLQNTPSARAKRQREEVLEVQDKLARDDSCLYLTFNVVVEGESEEELDEKIRKLVGVFHNDLECEVIEEDDIGLGLCLNTLPLNYIPKSDKSANRYIRILRSDATRFVPIFNSFNGLQNPLQLFLSRENNLVKFSLLENETSNHTVVLADSGSGKSAFIIDAIVAAKRMDPEPLVFVIDKKSSYLMLSEYFDGDLTVFDDNKEMPFSPFRGIYDEKKITFLTNLLATSIKLTSPEFEIESEQIAAITKALKLAYQKKKNQMGLSYVEGNLLNQDTEDEVELTMNDFISELASLPAHEDFNSLEKSIETIINKLKPFYGDGIYAKYFSGSKKRTSFKQNLFYIYDLDALDSDPILQTLMTLSIFEEIRKIISLPENKERGGFIVIEEIGMIGRNNPTASKQIIDVAETFRKLGFWLIGLTPRPQNYFEIEAGKAMWGVADNFIFLKMSGDNVEYLTQKSAILDSANKEIIKSLETKSGEYAEIFYANKNKTMQGAFRYFQTPYDRWLAPTNAKEACEADKALKKFKDNKWKALEYLATKYPKGVK